MKTIMELIIKKKIIIVNTIYLTKYFIPIVFLRMKKIQSERWIRKNDKENNSNTIIVQATLLEKKINNKTKTADRFDQYQLKIILPSFIVVVYHIYCICLKKKDFIFYQNVAIQLKRNRQKNISLVMDKKSFETIHDIIDQSIQDEQYSKKIRKKITITYKKIIFLFHFYMEKIKRFFFSLEW